MYLCAVYYNLPFMCTGRARGWTFALLKTTRNLEASCPPIRPGFALRRYLLPPIPTPLSRDTSAIHHHLIRTKQRTQVGLLVEAGDVREVHHVALLVGYGAAAVNPYLAMESVEDLAREAYYVKVEPEKAVANLIKALGKGVLKVMSKMGISTLASYKGAQIFEALGLDDDVVEKSFRGTASRIKGATFEIIAEDAFRFHERGFPSRYTVGVTGLPESGEYHWRDGGEAHINDPTSIANIQDAVRTKNDKSYEAYSRSEYEQIKACTLRGMLDEVGQTITVHAL